MRLVVKKSDRTHLRNCCNRQPIVGAIIDFADEKPSQFDIFCPICKRYVACDTFNLACSQWNCDIENEGFMKNYKEGVFFEGST